MTGARKPGPRGEHGISRKTIAWGMPDVSGASAVNTRVHTKTTMRTRGCGCIGHPAFPAPSFNSGGDARTGSGANSRRENAGAYPVGCLKFASGIASEAACGRASGEVKRPCKSQKEWIASSQVLRAMTEELRTSRLQRSTKMPSTSLRAQRRNPSHRGKERIDCFVADAPRNDGSEFTAPSPRGSTKTRPARRTCSRTTRAR